MANANIANVRKVLAAWCAVNEEMANPQPLADLLGLYAQAEVLRGKLARVYAQSRATVKLLRPFEEADLLVPTRLLMHDGTQAANGQTQDVSIALSRQLGELEQRWRDDAA